MVAISGIKIRFAIGIVLLGQFLIYTVPGTDKFYLVEKSKGVIHNTSENKNLTYFKTFQFFINILNMKLNKFIWFFKTY